MSDPVSLIPIDGVPEAEPGDDVASMLLDGLRASGIALEDGDVLVVTHKIVSKAEGRVVDLADPGPDGHRHLIEQEAAAILRRRGPLTITQTPHGFVCANAGVDRSNVAPGRAVLLPIDPDASAHRIRVRMERALGVSIAVIITDTFGRAWRAGLCDVAIGLSGMHPIADHRGTQDTHGNTLEVTEVAVADEIAAAADLVIGKATGIPAAIVRGVDYPHGDGRATDLVRDAAGDMFR